MGETDAGPDFVAEGLGGKLQDRVALITGGGRGIGRSIALAFAREAATVAVGARTVSEVEAVAEECRREGVEALAFHLDVTNLDSCIGAVDQVEVEFGRVDVLVNNAGLATSHKFTDVTDDIWRQTMDVDLTGPFWMTRAVLPGMLERHDGVVIAINSIAGKAGAPYISPYVTAKHGLIGLMRALAAEYARSGVTFNNVCPAYVDTSMTEGAIKTIMAKTGRSRNDAVRSLLTPQGRLIHPEEVAAVCVLLASAEGRSITGQAINIDGGQVPW